MRDGTEMWREVMQGDPPPIHDGGYVDLTRDHVFGEIWTRGELSVRDRRLISLTCTALTPSGPALGVHLANALKSGDLTAEQVEEWIIHLAHYAGWPVSANVYTVTRPILAQHRAGEL